MGLIPARNVTGFDPRGSTGVILLEDIMKRSETRFNRHVNRPRSLRGLRRAWDRLGAMTLRTSTPVTIDLDCAGCGRTFDPETVPQGSLACPHCGNTDW